ncbi:hypothetical protein JHW43_006075 [Diplocarpon mali]|nr:hypothetical protein JHW43_006075 [Diplocarpon mali]
MYSKTILMGLLASLIAAAAAHGPIVQPIDSVAAREESPAEPLLPLSARDLETGHDHRGAETRPSAAREPADAGFEPTYTKRSVPADPESVAKRNAPVPFSG